MLEMCDRQLAAMSLRMHRYTAMTEGLFERLMAAAKALSEDERAELVEECGGEYDGNLEAAFVDAPSEVLAYALRSLGQPVSPTH